LRSAGIPVAVEYAPQWGAYFTGHSWNVIIDENGKSVPCSIWTKAGEWKIDERIDPPKVYRYVYSIDREKEKAIAKAKNFVPELFKKNLQDVTAEYVSVSDVELKARDNLMYLCVFDNRNWKPVAMGFKKRGKAVFRDAGRKVVYLPTFYKGEDMYCSDFPFLLDSLGNIQRLEPDLQNTQKMKVVRKFHSRRVGSYYDRMLHGKFQGANKPDFSDATTFYEITEIPPLWFSDADFKSPDREFRYFRYISEKKGGFCNVAEIVVLSESGEKLTGQIIGSPSSSEYWNKGKEKEMVFDGNGLTYFQAATDSGGWVGLDFGKPQKIAKIRYLPRNDDNGIRNGDEYELFYMTKSGWQSLGVQTGTDSAELIYENCPTSALFWLRNHTRGKEERIFIYENGEQVFF
jgi:hypothetical protein